MNLFALLATIGLDTADFERGIDQSERRGKGFGATMAGVGASIAKACAAIGTAVLGMGTMAVKAGMEFGGSMDTIQARTGMTSDEIGTLNRTFRDMALEGRHSAKDIASAMAKVAVAGQDVNTATDLMRYSMVLADAVGKDLGSTAYFLGNYFLKVGKDMSYAEQYINMFAGAVQATGISLDTLQNYLFRSNVTLQTTNISGTEATAMFGLLYQAGIRGAYAYSGIEAATRSLLNPTEDMVYWLNRLGVERYEENGQLRDGLPFLKDVASAIDTLSGSYRSKAFDVLGATISGTAFLGGMIDIQDTLPDLVKELYEAGQVTDGMGIAFEMAEIQAGGLGQMFGKFRANINELKITFFDLIEVPLYEHLGNIAQVFSALVERISYGGDLHESMQAPADAFINLAGKVLDLVVAIIPIVIEWLPKLVNLLILLLDNAVPLLCVIGALYVLFKGYKALEYVGGFIKGLTAAKEGLTIAANASTAATRAGKRAFELYSRGVAALTKVKGYLAYAFKAVIKVLTGPAGIVIVIIAVIAFLVRLFKTNEEFREKVIKIWEAVRDFFKAVWEAIKAVFSAVVDFIRDLFTGWLERTRREWEIAWDTIKSVLQAAWDMIVGVIESVINIIQGIISTFISALTGDWQGAMDGLVDIGRNFLNLIGNVFGGITEIGRNLVGGLWEGISSRMGWIADNVRSFGSNIMGSIRNVFGISSPSCRFIEVGEQAGRGLYIGLHSLEDSVKLTDFYGRRIVERGAKTAKGFYDITAKNMGFIPMIMTDAKNQSLAIVDAWGMSEEARMKQKHDFISGINHLTLNETLDLLNRRREAGDLTIHEEIAMLEHLSENHRLSAAQRKTGDEELLEAQKTLRYESFNHSRQWIEKQLELGKMTAQEEIEAWERVVERHVEGSEERLQAEEMLAKRRDELNQMQMDALAEMERLEQAYIDAVDNRTRALVNTFDMFREINLSETNVDRSREAIGRAEEAYARAREELARVQESMRNAGESSESMARYQERLVTAQNNVQSAHKELTAAIQEGSRSQAAVMSDNLQGQLDNMREWERQMQKLSYRGIEEGLIEHFRQMGPTSTRYLQQLNQSSDQELTRLSQLYRHEESRRLAVNELQGLRIETNEQIAQILNDLTHAMSSQSNPIGKNMVQGIIDGVNAMEGVLYFTMQSRAQNALNAAKSTLQISSPSRAFMELGEDSTEGYIIGLENLIKEVKKIWDEVSLELSPINNQAAFSGVSAGNTDSSVPGIEINNNWYVEGQPTDIDIEQVRRINRYQMQELQDALRSAGYGGVS